MRSLPFLFPQFLLPVIPFRRRQDSSSSGSSDSSTSSNAGRSKPDARPPFLSGHVSYLRCARCSADLCLTTQVISKGFTGRHGRAYLVSSSTTASAISASATASAPTSSLPNTHTHKAVPRQLVTGAHTVSDISCLFCGTILGWKYVAAEDEAQRYKVGKFILETRKIRAAHFWEGEEHRMPPVALGLPDPEEDETQFDSQDEDECEDLFAGVWSPALALKRRKGKRFDRMEDEGLPAPEEPAELDLMRL
ncbi:MAG: hypothetical protein M1838_004052 [Thelocarpon superellum]|nr:MAG: hypothetical protein M1838_004052 [Thelocarpon superellum]